MNHPLRSGACASNTRSRWFWLAAALPDLALLCAATLIPATSAQSATAAAVGAGRFHVGQIEAVPPRATLVASPSSSPARAGGLRQVQKASPHPALAATAQPSVAARLALQVPALQPGKAAVWTEAGSDPDNGEALTPGVPWNPTRAPYTWDAVLTYLAGTAVIPASVLVTSSNPAASGGEYNTAAVDLTRATVASEVAGLTLTSYTTLVMTTAPGSALQLINITLAAGSPALQNSLLLSSALNGFISVLGGSTKGTGITEVATIKSLAAVQSGAAHVLSLGLNGTTGTVTAVLQSGKGVQTLVLDNFTDGLAMRAMQSGNGTQTATGIVFKAAPDSIFVLRQQ